MICLLPDKIQEFKQAQDLHNQQTKDLWERVQKNHVDSASQLQSLRFQKMLDENSRR